MPGPVHETFTLRTPEGIELFGRRWRPEEPPSPAKPMILLAHGIESHTGWFEETASALASAGYRVGSVDRRGFGRSSGPRGHVNSSKEFLADLELLADSERSDFPDRPLIALGVSLGGLLVVALSMHRQGLFAAVVSIVPAIASFIKPRPAQILRAIYENVVQPDRLHPIPITLEMFTDEPDRLEFIEHDDFRARQVSVRFFWVLRGLQRWVSRNCSLMTAPLLTLLAEKDQIIDNGRVKAWLQRIPAQPSQLIEYRGMKHSILMEPCRGQVLNDIRMFLGRVEKACSG